MTDFDSMLWYFFRMKIDALLVGLLKIEHVVFLFNPFQVESRLHCFWLLYPQKLPGAIRGALFDDVILTLLMYDSSVINELFIEMLL